jgi:hypothetical protein
MNQENNSRTSQDFASQNLGGRTTPKDFFLHLGVIVALYAVVIALINLLFRVINVAFPQISQWDYYSSSSISFPVATIIIFFPLLILVSVFVNKSYEANPAKKQIWVRRWLLVLTLFVAGIVLAGDLVTLVYYFLDGRELTTAFVLKILSVLVVAAAVFGYVLEDLRDRLNSSKRKIWTIVVGVLLLAAIIAGFSVIGSPKTQRLIRYDEQKIYDLQSIQDQIVNYWQLKQSVPTSLEDLKDPISGFSIPVDQQTNIGYDYRKTGGLSFEICAEFNLPSRGSEPKSIAIRYPEFGLEPENWQHEAGKHCFVRTIDPERYPLIKR